MALSALPAAGGCFCVALLLAIIADSDPGAVYEQHRWLGVVVAAGAVCAFAAMMGWATLRHGGVPAPVLLMALVVAGVPFALPGGLFLPGAATAVAACAALASAGLAALDARHFAAAWKLLAPGLQARFGGFADWRSGYKYTVANSPGSPRVAPAAGAATVGLTLRARDRDACGRTVVRRFAVTWRLARTEAGWRATSAEARRLSGAPAAAYC